MNSTAATLAAVREHAEQLLNTIGVSRIIVVDDEYAPQVEELLGICSELGPRAATLPNLGDIDFEAPREIWTELVRDAWGELDDTARQRVLANARALGVAAALPAAEGEAEKDVDAKAADSLEDILRELAHCEYITLSLSGWKEQSNEFLDDDSAATTVLLFDRDFRREKEGTEHEGINLIREVQVKDVGYSGLISHTVRRGGEYNAWSSIAADHDLVRDKFLVIAKERLTSDTPDYYGFLGMLRLVALSGRYASVKSMAWDIFENSFDKAKTAMESLSVLDFDRIVFESSRREGVWEPETLFRVFGILIRKEAQLELHGDRHISAAVSGARGVSAMPEQVAFALGNEDTSREALRIQRFEIYDVGEELNRFHTPIELGDIFEKEPNGKRYMLLVQPCDLMVRSDGKRSYDDRLGRTGTIVELVVAAEKQKESWGELPFYDDETGSSVFADFAKVHQARLAVLDLCAIGADGMAKVDVNAPCSDLLIEPWKQRYPRLQTFFRTALERYGQLGDRQLSDELMSLALPRMSETVSVQVGTDDNAIRYGLKRVMRLRQPWSGALLTAFAQHHARAAFQHPFAHRIETQMDGNGDQAAAAEKDPAAMG